MSRPPDSDRVINVLAAAVRLPPAEWESFVRSQSNGDAELVAEVLSLLEVSPAGSEFLAQPLPERFGARDRPPKAFLEAETLVSGRYRIQELLARSGFATVYLAKDEKVAGKLVVVKLLDVSPGFPDDDSHQAEVQSLGRLSHPHIVALSDAGHLPDGTPFLVMSYVPGETLRARLQGGPLPLAHVGAVLKSAGQALAAAHRAGIWHLDVKPENIIVSDLGGPEERVTLVDFGIAQLVSWPRRRGGTSRYMAPEQHHAPSARCDLYALGVVAHEMLTGRTPPPVASFPDDTPSPLAAAIRQAIALEPEDRPVDMVTFLRDALAQPVRSFRREVWGLAALMAAVAVVFLVGSWYVRREAVPADAGASVALVRGGLVSEPLVTTAGFDYYPAFSADGQSIYYASGSEGHFDIFRQSLSGGSPFPVVVHAGDDRNPSPSPDGKSLVFFRVEGDRTTLMRLPLAPPGPAVELRQETELGTANWHPDGQHLLIGSTIPDSDTHRLEVFHVPSRTSRVLLDPVAGTRGDNHPVFSPDGRSVAFIRRRTQESGDLFVVSLDAELRAVGVPRRLTIQNEHLENPQWSADGREIIFPAGPLGHAVIQRVPAAGGTPSVIPGLLPDVERVTVHARTGKLAYSVHRSDSNVWRLALDTPPRLSPILASTYDDEEARVSPDGRMLAFSSSRSGSEQIWVSQADGSAARRITDLPAADAMGVVWSRDSRQLLISLRKKGFGERVYRASPSGVAGVVEVMREAKVTDVSRDGRWVYVIRNVSQPKRLWKTAYPLPTSGQPEFLPVTSEAAEFAREAADGRSVYFSQRQEKNGLWQVPFTGGPAQRIVAHLHRRNLFVPADNGVYYIAREGNDAWPAMFFRHHDGRTRRVFPFDREVFWGLDISPDQRSLLCSLYDIGNSDIMLVRDFR